MLVNLWDLEMEQKTVILLLTMLAGMWKAAAVDDAPVEVTTPHGRLRGIRRQVSGSGYVDTFLSIPYARPPVGDLRFRPPQAPDPWQGVRDGTYVRAQCPQYVFTGVPIDNLFPALEDCLLLNVYTTQSTTGNRQLQPVMVWIHGGAFNQGTGSLYDGTWLASKGVVVVSVNYRLDALGFLSTEDEASPGNYGLLDCIRALEWVRDVISVFNGDPGNVVIFGESAGSGIVSLLLHAKPARGLFHKAIMESGSSLSPWAVGLGQSAVEPRPLQVALTLASRMGCDDANTAAVVECLRSQDVQQLVNVSWTIFAESNYRILFRPTVLVGNEDSLLNVLPEVALEQHQVADVPTIRGFTSDEWARVVLDSDSDGLLTEEEWRQVLSGFLDQWFIVQPAFHNDINTFVEGVSQAYISPSRDNSSYLRHALIQAASDMLFVAPAVEELRLTTTGQSVSGSQHFLYRFSYRMTNSLQPTWAGVIHGEEIPFVFGLPYGSSVNWSPYFPSDFSDQDRRVADDVMTMWTNFAKHGNPTAEGSNITPVWLPWTPCSPQVLDIGETLTMTGSPQVPPVSFPHSLQSASGTDPDPPVG